MAVSLGSATVSLGIDSSALSSGVNVAKNALSQLASGDIAGAVTTGLVAAGAAAVGFGVASVGAAADFQTGMSKVAAYVGLTVPQTDALGKSILSLASAMGQSPKAMADALYPIMSSGYTASQALNILKLSAMTAAASGANMATVADALTTSLKAMKAPASDAGIYMDMMNKIVALGKGQVSDYAAVIGKLSLAARSAHVPFGDMGAALADLTTHGFPSVAQASTALGNLFTQIGPKVDAVAAHAKKLGLSFDESAFKTMSLSQKMAYLNQVTGGNQGEMLKLLNGNTLALKAFNAMEGSVGDLTSNMNAMKNATGTTSEVFQKTYGDWNNATARLSSTFQVLMVQVGQGLLPVLTPMLDSVTNIVGAFAGWLTSSNAISNAMSFLGNMAKGVGTALQPLGSMISGLFSGGGNKKQASPFASIMADIKPFIQGFQSMEPAFKQFGSSLQGSVGPALKEISGIIQGQLASNLKFVGAEVQQIGGWFKSTLAPAITAAMPGFSKLASVLISDVIPGLVKIWAIGQQVIQGVFKAFIPVIEAALPVFIKLYGIIANGLGNALQFIMPYIVQAAAAIGQFATEIASRVAPILINFFKSAQIGIDAFMVVWKVAWPYVSQILKGVWDEISGVVKIAWAIVSGIIKIGLDLLSGNWSQAWTDLKDMLSGVWDGIKQVISGGLEIIKGWLSAAWDAIKGPLESAWNGIKGFFVGLWNGIKSGVTNFLGAICGFFSGAWDNIKKLATTFWDDEKKGWTIIFDTVKKVVQTGWNDITGFFSGAWDKITGWASDFWDREKRGWTNIFDAVKNTVQTGWNNVTGFFSGAFNKIKGWATTFWDDEVRGWTNIWNTVKKLVSDGWNNITTAFNNAWTNLKNALGTLWTNFSNWFGNLATQAIQWGENIINGIVAGIKNVAGNIGNAISGAIGDVKGGLHNAGVPGFAGGVQNFSGGWAVVGENGPELVNLPQGSNVVPQSAASMGTPAVPTSSASTYAPAISQGNSQHPPVIHNYFTVTLDGQEMTNTFMQHATSMMRSNGPVGRAA